MSNEVITQNDALLMDDHYMRLAEFFDLEERTDRMDNLEALKEIYDWAKFKTGSEKPIDILLHIRDVERGLMGSTEEPRIRKIRRYIALSSDQENVEKEMKLLKGTDE